MENKTSEIEKGNNAAQRKIERMEKSNWKKELERQIQLGIQRKIF